MTMETNKPLDEIAREQIARHKRIHPTLGIGEWALRLDCEECNDCRAIQRLLLKQVHPDWRVGESEEKCICGEGVNLLTTCRSSMPDPWQRNHRQRGPQ